VENSLANILNTPQGAADWASGKGWKEGPLAKKAQYLKGEISSLYTEARTNASAELVQKTTLITEKAKLKVIELDKQFEPQYKACEGVGGNCMENVMYKYCLAKEALDNEHFSKLTKTAEDFEEYWYPKDVKQYNNLVFLTTLTSPNEKVLKGETAAYTGFLLTQIDIFPLSKCYIIAKPDCVKPPPAEPEEKLFPEFKEGECPVNIRIPFIVGHISLNCERFEFEGGEGVIFKYEKDFKSRESSFMVGAGVEAAIPGFDGSATALVGFKFNSNNETVDIMASTKADVNLLGHGTPVISAGAKVGVSSGFSSAFTVMGK
jgi:hypothetical protein